MTIAPVLRPRKHRVVQHAAPFELRLYTAADAEDWTLHWFDRRGQLQSRRLGRRKRVRA